MADGLDHSLITEITYMLHEDARNPFIGIYRTAAAIFRERSTGTVILNPQLRLVLEDGADRRRENLPVGDEIAVLIPDEVSEPSFRDILLAR